MKTLRPMSSPLRWPLWAPTLLAASLLMSPAGAAPAAPNAATVQAQTLLPARSELTFTARQLGVPLQGRFTRYAVRSQFDPKALATSRITLEVELASIDLNPEADAEMGKPTWFDTGRFAKALFVSTAIRAAGPGRYEVAGKLQIKGLTRDVVVPVQVSQAQGLTTASGSFVLKRLDYQVGDGDWADPSIVANEVQVQFKFVLQGVPAL